MLGFLVNQKEASEMEYLIRRELDELLFDLRDDRFDQVVKGAMSERYSTLFTLYKRVAPPKECLKYIRKRGSKKIF
ncbi:hypothetical protein RCG17_14105 [Neobacillus sp. PS3-12]|jgi:hypothetical protein|uniref:hypothetical protein n=1 Tax=Neobacillus sp. PS3-12 TaxID=3070677 RepID=UPI0027DFE50E|nr:hypothetical protein [Neobacillus sp. PS3-12]WML55588.1 hypothetical protein RCG17_14105 [Neobacillus sp. PS3-12]